MFEDFGGSGKGPGTVGILLAFLVLAGFSGLAISVYYDGGSSTGKSMEAKVSDNEVDIELKKKTLVEMEEKLALFKGHQKKALEVTSKERQIKLSEEDKAALEQKKADALDKVVEQKTAFQEYRQQYRLAERSAAVGEVIDLSETKGPDYKEVTILAISATAFKVRSKTGPKGLDPKELPPAIQDRFQFSEDEAEEHKKLLAERAKIHNARMAANEKVLDAKRADRKAANKEARIKFLEKEIDRLTEVAKQRRDQSRDFDEQAQRHLMDDKNSRAGGKRGMHKALAREDENKSKVYAAQANKAQKMADEYLRELNELSR